MHSGVKFCIQFHVLALGGCDAVLGTQWLSTLGEIQWNFKLLTIIFCYESHKVLSRINSILGVFHCGL